MPTMWIVIICVGVYIGIIFPLAVVVGRYLKKFMAENYPDVPPEEEK